jgi:F0F1-type ATP synthase, subunit c/Archaeal/vacuolar-type H+-ATPase, subunit K
MELEVMKQLAAALAIGLGAIGPGLGSVLSAAAPWRRSGATRKRREKISTNMILAIAFTDAIAIFALVVALIIIFI